MDSLGGVLPVPIPLLSGGEDKMGGGGAILQIWSFEVVLGNVLADFLRIFFSEYFMN